MRGGQWVPPLECLSDSHPGALVHRSTPHLYYIVLRLTCIFPQENGWTALLGAAYYGHVDVVQALLDAKADKNVNVTVGTMSRGD